MKPLLLIALMCVPAAADDDRPSLSVPEPTRQRSTPSPEGEFTIVQVDYNDAIKERDYLSMAAQELVSYTSAAARLEVQLNWRMLSLDNPRIADALMLYMTGSDGVVRLSDAEKQGLAQYLRQGGRWRKSPKNDPSYSSSFDFPDGPPMNGARRGNVFALEALELRGRTTVVFSDLNISWFWGNRDADGRDRNLQFGTNLVVFALTKQFAGRPLPVGR